MELRDIEIFLTLAEELHFARTAERLHVSSARVSQAIKLQERRIGADLFVRTSRQVTLTPIGEELRRHLQLGYQHITRGIEQASAMARGTTGTLTLGVFGPLAHELSGIIERFTAGNPGSEIAFREVLFSNPFGLLRSGEVDLQTCWLPVREPDLAVGPVVHTDHLRLMVSAAHPFAGRDSVCLEDLGDCTFIQSAPAMPAYWEEALMPFFTPSGRPIPRGPKVSTFQEVQAVVGTNQAVCMVHGDAARYYPIPGMVYLPVRDAPLSRWALIWRHDAETPLLKAFLDAV